MYRACVRIALYYSVYISMIIQTLRLSKERTPTRNGLSFCLIYRIIPALTIQFVVGRYVHPVVCIDYVSIANRPYLPRPATTHWDILCDGFFMSVVTSDLILAKVRLPRRSSYPRLPLFNFFFCCFPSNCRWLRGICIRGLLSSLCFRSSTISRPFRYDRRPERALSALFLT